MTTHRNLSIAIETLVNEFERRQKNLKNLNVLQMLIFHTSGFSSVIMKIGNTKIPTNISENLSLNKFLRLTKKSLIKNLTGKGK
jgi:hypothetical protein